MNNPDKLEDALRSLCWWTDEAPGVWRNALEEHDRQTERAASRPVRILRSRWLWAGTPIAAVIAMAIGLAIYDQLDGQRTAARRIQAQASLKGIGTGMFAYEPTGGEQTPQEDPESRQSDTGDGYAVVMQVGAPSAVDARRVMRRLQEGDRGTEWRRVVWSVVPPAADYASQQDPRHVIRRATVELEVGDLEGTYRQLVAGSVLSDENEFVERSEFDDRRGRRSASIVIRVRAERLDEVLNGLRDLGRVLNENADARDVTSQVVDLDARLRNERRVEEEMLDLLSRRENAPLEDVLRVRQSLAEVRERIERLVAEQQQVSREVALARVAVSLWQAGAVDVRTRPRERFLTRLGVAWDDGVDMLMGSIAWLVHALVGGLVWWIGLVVLLLLIRRRLLRRPASPVG